MELLQSCAKSSWYLHCLIFWQRGWHLTKWLLRFCVIRWHEYFRCNMVGYLVQDHCCWCPGDSVSQGISSNDIHHTGSSWFCLSWGTISPTYTISVLRNDRKCSCIIIVHKNRWSPLRVKGCCLMCQLLRWLRWFVCVVNHTMAGKGGNIVPCWTPLLEHYSISRRVSARKT